MIVVVGEALIDVVTDADGSTHEAVGGSAVNVAVGLARLETPTVLITQVGSDERGRRVVDHVTSSGAELVAAPTGTGRTATASARLGVDGTAEYAFDLDWTLPSQELPGCDALHVGALGSLLEPGRTSTWDLVEQAYARGVPVSYDPNVRAAVVDDPDQVWRDVETLADRATIVKISDQDVALLHPAADPTDIARSLLAGDRTELVLLTRGAGGATAYAEGHQVWVPTPATTVVDTVGAGDAFMAGALTVLLESDALGAHGSGIPGDDDALHRLVSAAMEVAALTCARRGAQPPTRSELPVGWPG